MLTLSPSKAPPAVKFEYLNWLASDPLPRDQMQSDRVHEPEHPINISDPVYQRTAINEPNVRLPYPAEDGDDRGG